MEFDLKNSRTLAECKKELQSCSSMNEMFDVLDEYYDLDAPVGFLTKTALVSQLGKAIKFVRPKMREKNG